jgi:hypothetical protein
VLDKLRVEVVTTQVIVTVTCQHLRDVLVEAHDRDVEGAAAKVVDQDVLAGLVVGFVGQRGGGGLVDDAHHFETGELARIPGGLPLGIGEVGGYRYHGLGDGTSQVLLRGLLEPPEDEGRDLLGRIALVPHGETHVLAHAALNRTDRALRVEDVLIARRLTDQQGAVVRYPHHRGQDLGAVSRDDAGTALLHHRHFRVRRSEIDSDNDVVHVVVS